MSTTSRASLDLRDAVRRLRVAVDPRAKSLIVTVLGDSLSVHGGTVWLGSLVRLLEPMGLNERLVRTSVYRLMRDGWLESRQVGRRSYYAITRAGVASIERVRPKLYGLPRSTAETWCLVLLGLGELDADRRQAVRRELLWLGFGTVAPNVLAHPTMGLAAVREVLAEYDAAESVVVMTGARGRLLGDGSPEELLRRCWDLDDLADGYRRFNARFAPIAAAIGSDASADPECSFVLRTLLMHEFRRILLRDPDLPAALLPADWPGHPARALCRALYGLVESGARRYLLGVAETADGPLPEADASYFRRFGGFEPSRGGGLNEGF